MKLLPLWTCWLQSGFEEKITEMGSQSHRISNKQMRTSLKHSICNIAPDQVTLRLYVEK